MARILIVDDSITSRAIVASLIEGGHALVEADSGPAALALLSAGHFDLIVLDLLMPGMGGMDVLAELRARGSRVPVIVATADIQNSTRARAEALGASALVNKPLRKDTLNAAIRSVLSPNGRQAGTALDPFIKDSLEELMNLAIGKAADVLNTMLSSHISLSVPSIESITAEELSARFSRGGAEKLAAIEMRCTGGLNASIELIFTSEDAVKLADCIMGLQKADAVDRDSMRAGALCEVGNIVINAIFGTISNSLDIDLSFTVPSYLEGGAAALVGEISLGALGVILLVRTRFEISDLSIDGDIALFLSLRSFESLSRMMGERAGKRP